MIRLLSVLLLVVPFAAAAANNDDGFVWVDANTKIKLQPIGSASAATGGSVPEKAPEEPKKQKRQKQKK
jgi:hypothetical protein